MGVDFHGIRRLAVFIGLLRIPDGKRRGTTTVHVEGVTGAIFLQQLGDFTGGGADGIVLLAAVNNDEIDVAAIL